MSGRRAMVLWSGVVLLASAPVSLLLTGETFWMWAAGKAAVGTIMILSVLLSGKDPLLGHARGRIRRAALPAAAAIASLSLVMAAGIGAGGKPIFVHFPGQVKVSPDLAGLLERARGGLRVTAFVMPSDGRRRYLHALLRKISRERDGFEYEFANPAGGQELARRFGLRRAAAGLVLEQGGKAEVVVLGQDPQYALALGLSRLLGQREPPVLRSGLSGQAVLVVSDGAFLLLGVTCLDAIPLILVLLALWRRQESRRRMAMPGRDRPEGKGVEG